MSGITKLGLGLLIVFAVSITGLVAEVVYLLWHRRRRLRRGSAEADPESWGGDVASKEMFLYFLCWKNHSRVEPASAATSPAVVPRKRPSAAEEEEEEEDGEVAFWQAMRYGPSRVLYTIREEEREGTEEEVGRSGGEEEESFSTPCSLPPFYTPSSSPPRVSAEPAAVAVGAL